MRAKLVSALTTLALLSGAVGAYALTRPETDIYTVTADVDQAPNLFEGGRVMIRGIQVGKIVEVEPGPTGVRLTMELESSVPVPADASLSVIPVTVIADRYVQLFPAYISGPRLEEGAHITDTTIPAELEDVLAQLQGLLEALEPQPGEAKGSLRRLIESLDSVLANRSGELAGTLKGSAEVLDNLADSNRNITSLITNLDGFFARLATRSSQIAVVNERFDLVVSALLDDQDNLEGTIENLAFLAGETAGLLDESGDRLGSSLGRLGRVLRTVLDHQDELADGMRWGNVIAQATGAVNGSGKGLFAYTGRQVPPGTEGAEYNYRIDTRDVISCERIQKVANSVIAVLPEADEAEVLSTLLSFIPDPYDEHLSFLLALLIPACVDQFSQSSALAPATEEALQVLVDEIGRERVLKLLADYLVGRDEV